MAALLFPVTSGRKIDDQEESKLNRYCEMASYLLETFATDNIITEDEGEIVNFKQPVWMTAATYSEILLEKRFHVEINTTNYG